jgi:gamma-tubulin complex component 3
MHGELNDSHKEFFIGINQEVTVSGGSLWHDLYFIRSSMLPAFFSKELAQKVLVIGKSINFLRACSHSGSWDKAAAAQEPRSAAAELEEEEEEDQQEDQEEGLPERAAAAAAVSLVLSEEQLAQLESRMRAFRYGDEEKLSELVSEVALATDARLLSVMLQRASLMRHLLALKKFMLLGQVRGTCSFAAAGGSFSRDASVDGQGDFVTCLMDAVGAELKKRATQLYRHNLTGRSISRWQRIFPFDLTCCVCACRNTRGGPAIVQYPVRALFRFG